MAAFGQSKRLFTIAFALVGFYISRSIWFTALMLLVGAISYLAIIFETMQKLPSLPSAPTPRPEADLPAPKRILRFSAGNGPNQEQKIRDVIQQQAKKPTVLPLSSKALTNTPNSAQRVKI